MRIFAALIKVNFRAMLSNFAGSKSSKKRAATGYGALALMAFLGIYLSGVYSFMFGSQLGPVGMISLVPIIMATLGIVMSLLFTAFAASGIVFGNKDSDLMLSLPVSSFAVMLSKIMALYIENLFFSVFIMIPAGISYIFYGGEGGIGFILRYVICQFFLPIISTLLSLLVGFLLSLMQAKFGQNALLGNLAYLIFFVGIMALSLQLNTLTSSLLQNGSAVNEVFSTWLYPLGLFRDAINGSWLALIGFIAITIIPFLLIVYFASIKYKKILTMLGSKKTRSDYRITSMKSSGQLSALIKKEFGRFFGTPIYVFNTGIGVIMALGGAIFAVVKRNDLQILLMQIGGTDNLPIVAILAVALAFCCSTICPACVSISLEGKTLWILKEAPIPTNYLLLSKGIVNAVLIWILAITAVPLIGYAFSLSIFAILALFTLCISFGFFNALFGLFINLMFPKMDGENDTLIVKQSTAAMLGVFGTFGVMGIGIGGYFLFSISDNVYILLCSAVLLLTSLILWSFLSKKGTKILQKL